MSEEEKNEKKKARIKEVLSWVYTIVFAVVIAYAINNLVIVNASVPSSSMESTISPGNRLVALRWSYLFSEPKRFDIVVFKYPDDESTLFVKRVIGLPGETVRVEDGTVFVNDKPIDDAKYIKEPPTTNSGPYVVPENSYFMMGDNRNNSLDSRYWQNKYVKKEKILGKVFIKYFPKFELLYNK